MKSALLAVMTVSKNGGHPLRKLLPLLSGLWTAMKPQNLRRHDECRKEGKRITVQLLGEMDRVKRGRLVCSDSEDKACSIKDRILMLKADHDIFARMLVICGKRNVLLKEVLTYSLGPIPWSLATADGDFVKSVKSKLLDTIEKDVANPMVDAL